DVGNAWWLLCHPSPRLSSATAGLLALWSPLRKGRAPHTWQTELTLHVTCCISAIRPSPPHRKPDSAPPHERVISPTTTAGTSIPRNTHAKYIRSTKSIARSAVRSRTERPQS